MVLSSFATCLRRRAVRPLAWFEEETKQHASADNLGSDRKAKKGIRISSKMIDVAIA